MSQVKVSKTKQTPFLLRALWFVLFGWELAAIWILVAWFLNLTVIGLPAGLWMLNRLPTVLTLKSTSGNVIMDTESGNTYTTASKQLPFLIRAIYFALVGWWLSLTIAVLGYFLCVSIIGLPFGLVILNNLPMVTTLRR